MDFRNKRKKCTNCGDYAFCNAEGICTDCQEEAAVTPCEECGEYAVCNEEGLCEECAEEANEIEIPEFHEGHK